MSVAPPPPRRELPFDQPELLRSRDYCQRLTRTAARNFYYGLKLLPEPKRSAMFTLYSYMRVVDDIADEDDGNRSVAQRLADLDAWRAQTHEATCGRRPCAGDDEPHPLWPAFCEMVHRHKVPVALFDDVIAGQRQDLQPLRFETFEQLHEYCYRVAGVVGLASITIWGYSGGAETEALAVKRGVAFQLTNILRDLREDADRGRVYLPREDLAAADLNERDVIEGAGDDRFLELMRFQIERAESYYRDSRDLEHRIDRDSRPTLVAMTEIYHGLLRKIADEPQRVLRERVSLSVLRKLQIGWRAMRSLRGSATAATTVTATQTS
jgi:phytoene synthase